MSKNELESAAFAKVVELGWAERGLDERPILLSEGIAMVECFKAGYALANRAKAKQEIARNVEALSLAVAPLSYHPNVGDTALDSLVAAVIHQLTLARAALTSSLGGVETGGWVPVEERLPEFVPGTDYSPRVLALGDGGIDGPQFVAYCAKSYGWFLAHDNQPNMKVTHWQPLPAVPHA